MKILRFFISSPGDVFEEAIEGFRKNGKPDLLVYRKTAPPSVRLDDEKELLDRLSQKKKRDEFVDKWFHDKTEGTLVAAFHAFEAPSDFEEMLENHLRRLIDRQIPASMASTSEARVVWKKGSPFRRLEAFEVEHAACVLWPHRSRVGYPAASAGPGCRQ